MLTLIAIGGGVGRKIHVSVVIQIHVGGCDEEDEEEERVLMILATLLMMVEIMSSSFSSHC